MTVQEKLESLVFSETERALIRKWLNETPSRSRYALPGTASASLLYPERYNVGVTGDGVQHRAARGGSVNVGGKVHAD